MSEAMRPEVMFAIREAGLEAAEKSILWAVESRGVSYRTWQGMCRDTGMAKNTFYRWRKRLLEKGLLEVSERPGATTTYRVLEGGLRSYCEASAPAEESQGFRSTCERGFAAHAQGVSHVEVTEEEPQNDPEKDLESHHLVRPSDLWDAWDEVALRAYEGDLD